MADYADCNFLPLVGIQWVQNDQLSLDKCDPFLLHHGEKQLRCRILNKQW